MEKRKYYKKQEKKETYEESINKLPPEMVYLKVQMREYNGNYMVETTDFGYRINVQSEIEAQMYDDGNYYIYYNKQKAGLLINENGYPFLFIKK